MAPQNWQSEWEKVTAAAGYRDEQGRSTYPKNALRHSFGTYRLSLVQENQVAAEMGNSPNIFLKHYKKVVKRRLVQKYFASPLQLLPSSEVQGNLRANVSDYSMNEEDYNKKRTISEFFFWNEEWRTGKFTLGNIMSLLERSNQTDTKVMEEEALPIYNYLKLSETPKTYKIQLCKGSQTYDAILYDEQDNLLTYLETTTVPDRQEYKDRDMLVKGGGSITLPDMLYASVNIESLPQYIESAKKQFKKKLEKKYPPNTTLIISIPDQFKNDFDKIVESLDIENAITFIEIFVIAVGKFAKLKIL